VVEFSLVSLTLFMLIFGMLDLGRGVFHRTLLTNAVRDATRYGQVNDRTNATTYYNGVVAAAARRSPSLGVASGDVTVVCSTSWSDLTLGDLNTCDDSNMAGARLTVCIRKDFGLAAPRLVGFGSIPMRECARATLR
jgi:Flp pilus assembly protein TadG